MGIGKIGTVTIFLLSAYVIHSANELENGDCPYFSTQ